MALRLQVTRQILDEHLPASRVARAFGLSLTTVNEWLRRYKADGEAGLVPKPQGPDNDEARRRPSHRTSPGDLTRLLDGACPSQ